ncbi:MAG TPA: hypothetical protein VIS94_01965 [Desulfomonilia bacterium]
MAGKNIFTVALEEKTIELLRFLEMQTSIPQASHVRNALKLYFSLVKEYGYDFIFEASSMDQATLAKYYVRIKEAPKTQLKTEVVKDINQVVSARSQKRKNDDSGTKEKKLPV